MTAYHSDPGLQPERTELSWNRTVLALMVGAATQLRWAGEYPAMILIPTAVIITLAAVITSRATSRYKREAISLEKESTQPAIGSVLTVTVCMVVVGATEIVLLLV